MLIYGELVAAHSFYYLRIWGPDHPPRGGVTCKLETGATQSPRTVAGRCPSVHNNCSCNGTCRLETAGGVLKVQRERTNTLRDRVCSFTADVGAVRPRKRKRKTEERTSARLEGRGNLPESTAAPHNVGESRDSRGQGHPWQNIQTATQGEATMGYSDGMAVQVPSKHCGGTGR